MTTEQRRAYTETLIILGKLELDSLLPKDIIENMNKEKDETWDFIYNENLPLEEQKVLKRTSALLSIIYLMYLCDDIEEKKELKLLYEENEIKSDEETKIKLKALYNQIYGKSN